MPIVRLHSVDDPRLTTYRQLKRSNGSRWNPQFVAEGERLFDRMLAVDWPMASILLAETHVDRLESRLPPQVPTYVLPAATIEEVIGFNFHRGVLTAGLRPTPKDASLILPHPPNAARIVVLVDVHDPQNVGTIIRTAAGFGVNAVVLSARCADPFSRRVLRTSMGSVLSIPTLVVGNVRERIRQWQIEQDLTIVATSLGEDSTPIDEFRWPCRHALVLGNEGDGLNPAFLALADKRVTIPMAGETDSLNVAVACGIFLHHAASPRPR